MDVAPRDAVGQTPVSTAPGTDPAGTPRRPWVRELPVLVLIALVLTLAVRLLLVQAFYIPSGSMEPTLDVGDRVLVSKLSYRLGDVHRGDVVVFDGRGSFAPVDAPVSSGGLLGRAARTIGAFAGISPSERDFVKRVVGLPGDHVVCCDASDRITVDGQPVDEYYVHEGDAASDQPFDIVVPSGRLWVMGDHRSDSADSRAHLGDPGGGTVPLDRVIGKVVLRFWPLDRLGGSDEMATGNGS